MLKISKLSSWRILDRTCIVLVITIGKCLFIPGGLGGFGLELTDWLVLRGAKKVVLSSRSGVREGYQSMRIKIWESYGVEIKICTDDISTDQGVISLLKKANELGPVGGIFNLAVVR